MKNLKSIIIIGWFFCLSLGLHATSPQKSNLFLAACARPVAAYDMHVNNVRARIFAGGNLFNDKYYGGNYFTPASSSPPVSAINGVGVWMGGVDRSGSIKVSAVSYSLDGSDFYSGPLDILGTTEATACDQWDKIFTVKGNNIMQHIQNYKEALENQTGLSCNDITDDILYWPAQGNPYFEEKYGWKLPDQPLANYFDENDDGYYDPCLGDYPIIDNASCANGIYKIPAEINFFIFNDAGGPQTFTKQAKLQMEFQVSAFAYNTTNELNDMTFYQYKLISKSSEDLIDCYFSWWIDPELGCYNDDYVGCNPELGMAYIYNEDALDGENNSCFGSDNYKDEIPMIGLNFVQGPKVVKIFKRDANGNIMYDADRKKILIDPEPLTGDVDTLVIGQMSSFINYENKTNIIDYIVKEIDFYWPMKGFWSDGTPLTFGGDGYNPTSSDIIKFAFPDDPNDPNGWSMCTANLSNYKNSMVMSVGPMLMLPGSTNTLTMSVFSVLGVPYPCPDLSKLRYANEIAKNLFENCLKDYYFIGPDAPDITFEQKNLALTLKLENAKSSNNFNESFSYTIPNLGSNVDSEFKFEGYKVYQVANNKVRIDQLSNPKYARLIAQCDIKNNTQDIYNWQSVLNPDTSANAEKYIWQKVLKVKAENVGLQHSFDITEDLFATGDKALYNNKYYHFCAVAYAHNNWKDFDSIENLGQKTPYLEGTNNFKVYTITPKLNIDEDLPQLKVTRISGEGNPHVFLKMEDDMYDKILSLNFDGKVNYKTGYGPLQAVVTDVTKINKNKYRLEITGTMDNYSVFCKYKEDAVWKLTDISNNIVLLEDKPLWYVKEYMINELGFSITIQNYENPGENAYENNGGVDVRLEYKDKSGPFWYNAIKDGGIYNGQIHKSFDFVQDNNVRDPEAKLSQMGDGFFTPFLLSKFGTDVDLPYYLSTASRDVMALVTSATAPSLRYRDLNNVDIIFTNDKSKWSKCIVVETGFNDQFDIGLASIGNAKNFEMRISPSIDENGVEIPVSTGFSYFPGYAVDVETGKRLNIFFGENSIYSGENATHMQGQKPIGGDMIFNPSSELIIEELLNSNLPSEQKLALIAGAQHYIYVTRMEYDGCAAFGERLKRSASGAGPSIINKAKVISSITWTSFPVLSLASLTNGLIPNDLTVSIRVDNTYSSSRIYQVEKERACLTTGDNPVYEFGFEKLDPNAQNNITLDNIYVNPNPVRLSNGATVFRLLNLPDDTEIQIMDMQGQVRWKADASSGDKQTYLGPGSTSTEFTLDGSRFLPGLYLISIKDKKSGKMSTLKWVGL
jgi:hypothetical protein